MPVKQQFEYVPKSSLGCSQSLQWEVASPLALELAGSTEPLRHLSINPFLLAGVAWDRAVLRPHLAANVPCGLVVLSRVASDVC